MCHIAKTHVCVPPVLDNLSPEASCQFPESHPIDVARLLETGIQEDDRTVPVQLGCVIADALAFTLIKGTVHFNSTSSCDKCATRAQWMYSRHSDNEAAAAE